MLSKIGFLLLLIIIFAHSLILTRLIFFPYPELFVYPYLTNNGLKPYAQILDQHFPGLLFLPINFDNLGMTDEVSARAWLIGTVVITHLLLFFISRQIFKSNKKALAVNLLFLLWQPFFEGWILWIDSFLSLMLLPAFYFVHRNKFFWTGILLGLGIVFKQVLIPLSLLVLIFILWEIRGRRVIRVTGMYLFGLSLPIALMIGYLLWIGVLKDFWYWTVVFNLTTYAQYGRGEMADFAHLSRVGLVFGTAFILILFILKDKMAQGLLIFLIGALIGLSTRFDFVHFQPALPFAVLATVYGLGRLGPSGWLGRLGVLGYVLVAVWWLGIFYRGHLGDNVFFFDQQTKLIAEKIKIYSKEDDKIFVFGAPPHLYQMAKRLPPGEIFVFQFPWFLEVAQDRVLEAFLKDEVEIVVSDRTVKIEDKAIIDFAPKLDNYIMENYQEIDSVGNIKILKKRGV